MNPTAKTIEQLGFIGGVLCVGGSYHRRFSIFVVFVVPSSRRNLKFLRVLKRTSWVFQIKNLAKGHFMFYQDYLKINLQHAGDVLVGRWDHRFHSTNMTRHLIDLVPGFALTTVIKAALVLEPKFGSWIWLSTGLDEVVST
jgi:hypothetical protein